MELLKNAKSAMNFQERYSDMEGSEGGYDRKEKRALKQAKKAGVGLNDSQSNRSEYLDTVGAERTRAAATGITAVAGVVAGAYTGNPAMVKSSLAMGANYMGGEMAEDAAGNDGVGQQLGIQDAMNIGGPLASTMGQGTREKKAEGGGPGGPPETPGVDPTAQDPYNPEYKHQRNGSTLQYKAGGSLRYNPRKYDYIKGNSFGF